MAEIDDHIAAFENELGLPSGFYDRLLKEDDWSFVIKLHALLESAVNHVLARRLGEVDLEVYLRLWNSATSDLESWPSLACWTALAPDRTA